MKNNIKYTHPAATGYNPNETYKLDAILKAEGLERTKILFSPVGFQWSDLDKEKSNNNKGSKREKQR